MERGLHVNASSKIESEELFRQYYTRFCHFAFQLLKDEKAAEDIVQDAFLSFWKNKELVSDNPIAIKNYFYSSIRNACYNIHRRAKVKQRFLQIYEPEFIEEPVFLKAMIRSEVMDQIYDAINSLPPSCCKIFKLGYLEGLTNPKIADKLGISINTVKTQKRRALITLRAKLNPELLALFLMISSKL